MLTILESRTLHWPNEEACRQFAQRLGALPDLRNASLELHGGLGAGKTTFTRHLLRALGVEGRIKSPSYAVLESYELRHGLAHHFDFYRFEDPREWEDAGFRELFAAPGLKISEWPDKAVGMLPRPDLRMRLEIDEAGGRLVTLEAASERGVAILRGLA
ncbi:MAG TPA: tRNA (adenosine(37)-N6)-threonylcarbamoyltransferase complex ATPase subunit type 1 TsaE [Burkholderiaceae bacterium]